MSLPEPLLQQIEAGSPLGAIHHWQATDRPSCVPVLHHLYTHYSEDRAPEWLTLALHDRTPGDARPIDLLLCNLLARETTPPEVLAVSALGRWLTVLLQGEDDEEMLYAVGELEVLTPGPAVLLGRHLSEDRYAQVLGNLEPIERCYLYLGRGQGPVPAELDRTFSEIWSAAVEDVDLMLLSLLWAVRGYVTPEPYTDPVCGTVRDDILPTLVVSALTRLSSHPMIWGGLWDLWRPDPTLRDTLLLQPYYLSGFPLPPVSGSGEDWILQTAGYATTTPPTWMQPLDTYLGWSLYPLPGTLQEPALQELRGAVRDRVLGDS